MGLCSSRDNEDPKGQPKSPSSHSDQGFSVVVNIIQARTVKKMDLFSESDPYIKVCVDGTEKRTRTVQNTSHPVWNEVLVFTSDRKPEKIDLVCMDKDTLSRDDFIGTATAEVADSDLKQGFRWLQLKDKDNQVTGEVQVSVEAAALSKGRAEQLAKYSFTHVLEVTVEKGENLKQEDLVSQNDAYVKVSWGTKSFRTSVKGGSNVEWNESVYFWVNKETQAHYKLAVGAWDKDVKNDDEIGTGYVSVTHLFENEEKSHPFTLNLSQSAGTDKELRRVSVETKEKTGEGRIIISARMVPKEVVMKGFFDMLLERFDLKKDGRLSREELFSMLEALNVSIPDDKFETLWAAADRDGNDLITPDEGQLLLRGLLFINADTANAVMTFILGGEQALDKRLMATETGDENAINVMDRSSGVVVKEHIPVYVNVALKSLFDSKVGRYISTSGKSAKIHKALTVARGVAYDKPESTKEIMKFVALHNLDLTEVVRPLEDFKNFNEFFYRELKPEARPIFKPGDNTVAVCPADCRLSAFPSVQDATKLWIKGDEFTVERVFGETAPRLADRFTNGSLVIARLAPQDYHRWHVPVAGRLGKQTPIDGLYYTVNPMAINKNVNVFTENKREILELESKEFGLVVMVAVGATMVGSINILAKEGTEVEKGDQHGYFAFGGSTVLIFFEPGRIELDLDLVANSKKSLETLVKVNTSLGKALKPE